MEFDLFFVYAIYRCNSDKLEIAKFDLFFFDSSLYNNNILIV